MKKSKIFICFVLMLCFALSLTLVACASSDAEVENNNINNNENNTNNNENNSLAEVITNVNKEEFEAALLLNNFYNVEIEQTRGNSVYNRKYEYASETIGKSYGYHGTIDEKNETFIWGEFFYDITSKNMYKYEKNDEAWQKKLISDIPFDSYPKEIHDMVSAYVTCLGYSAFVYDDLTKIYIAQGGDVPEGYAVKVQFANKKLVEIKVVRNDNGIAEEIIKFFNYGTTKIQLPIVS